MLIIYLILLIGVVGGWEQGLTDTPTFLLLLGLTFILFVKEAKKLNGQQRKSTGIGDHSEGD